MSTDEGSRSQHAPEAAVDPADGRDAGPSWWHRDHPTFYALTGFFAGLATVIVVPGAFAAILNAMFTYERAEDIFPLVLLIFIVPLGLIATPRTRRFGRYMLLGMLLTAVVVVGVAALMLWILYKFDS